MRNAAGEIDHVDAAGELAERIFMRLAVLLGDGAGNVAGVAIQQLLEAEHGLDALERGRDPPAGGCPFGRGDGGVHLVDGRERQLSCLLSCRRIIDG